MFPAAAVALGSASGDELEARQSRGTNQHRCGAHLKGIIEEGSILPDMVADMVGEFLDASMPIPKARRSTMSSDKPEEWPHLFE